MNKEFWRGKKVYLTGHTGFKGSWLLAWLLKLEAKVFCYSLPPETEPNLYSLIREKHQFGECIDDLGNLKLLTKTMMDFDPDICIHMAAQALVRRSYRDPIETIASNVLGTANVLQACRQVKNLKSTVVITTDKCYENLDEDRAFVETDRLGGHDPYSASKACAEIITSSMAKCYFGEANDSWVSSGRAGNVIGGGDWSAERLVPDCIRSFTQGKPVVLRNPDYTRPWQHVLDPLAGYMVLAEKVYTEKSKCAEAFNFGPEPIPSSVSKVAEAIGKKFGMETTWVQEDPNAEKFKEAKLLQLDPQKAKDKLGWVPTLNLEECIEWTADWYQKYYDNPATALDFTFQQISQFEDKMTF